MATDGFASRINGVEYAAVDERRMDSALLMPGPASSPFSARSGRRVNGSGLTVSVGGSPEAWTVSPGAGVIYDPAYASQGAWRFEIPSAVSANLPARPGVGQSRIDLIVARIYDPGALGSGSAEVKIERVNGVSGASPSAPSMPALSIELARLLVPASGTITITQSARRTVAAGGVLPVATTTEMDQLETDGIAYRGLVVDNAQTNALYRYDGTDWKALAEVGGDVQSLTVNANWTATGFGVAVEGKRAYLTGYLNRTNAGTFGDWANVCQLPAGTFPGHDVYPQLAPPRTGTTTVGMKITAAGVLQVYMSAYNSTLLPLEGANWRL